MDIRLTDPATFGRGPHRDRSRTAKARNEGDRPAGDTRRDEKRRRQPVEEDADEGRDAREKS